MEEVNTIFEQDIRDKKLASRRPVSSFSKPWFPSDLMSPKDKREYRRSSKVVYSNMYDNIIPLKEFMKLSKAKQREVMIRWREFYPVVEIKNKWGWTDYQYYKLLDQLNISRRKEVVDNPVEERVPVSSVHKAGLQFILNEENCTAKSISDRLLRIAGFLENEDSKFNITLTITEQVPGLEK